MYPMPESSLQTWLERDGFGKGLDIQISSKHKLLLSCKGFHDFMIDIRDTDDQAGGKKSLVMSALMMSGFLNQQFSYSGGTFDNPMEMKDTADIDRFKSWLPAFVKGKVFVPDTNAIMNCSLSGLKFIMGLDFLKKLPIQIPRLLVLELERKANPKSSDGEKAYLAKREAMLAYQELIYLKNSGASLLPELDKDTFDGFPRLSGEQMTDSWIRREIREAIIKNIRDDRKTVFFTSDLTSALSGIAEGLDTLYVSKLSSEEKLLRAGDLYQVSRLIVTLAALYNDITVSINSKQFLFKGMWTGKTTVDWIDYRVLYMPKAV
jgi:hypothetical protein